MNAIAASPSRATPQLLTDTLTRAVDTEGGQIPSGLVDLDGSIRSWADVRTAARAVAARLVDAGVRPGDRVAVLHPKSAVSFIAMHSALLAGAIAVPLDPLGSAAAIESVLEQCEVAALIGASESIARLAIGPVASAAYLVIHTGDAARLDGIEIDRLLGWDEACTTGTSTDTLPAMKPDDPAYLIFTSGSTGVPKGIVHTHASGMAYAITAVEKHRLSPASRVAGIPPLHFDMSTLELYATPLAGATVITISEAEQRFPATLSKRLQDEQVTHIYAVPFLLRQLQERGALDQRDLSSLAHVGYAGEPFAPGALGELMRALPDVPVTNFYGPAETNVVTSHDLDGPPEPDVEVPIGTLWPDCEQRLVDGELWVSAPTCMQGYWRRPDLSEGRLEPRYDGSSWYATGDLVTVDTTGVITYTGRRDHQVKVRGVRLELEAVESVLTDAPGIEHAVVGAVDGTDGGRTLAACVVLEDIEPAIGGDKTDVVDVVDVQRRVKEWCAGRLPGVAIPTRVIVRQELPTTASGKLNRALVRTWLSDG